MAIDILQISKTALEAQKTNPDVINASIGMFFDETRHIGGMPSVSKALRELPDMSILPYPAVDGGKDFKDHVISWTFGQYEDQIRKEMYVDACATPGGSGAIASTFSVYTKPNDFVFVSNVRWQYDRFADRAKIKLFEHNMFDQGGFDLKSFDEQLGNLCKIQKQVVVIVNDPCHNPTGYTLSLDEFKAVIDILNKYHKNDIVFLYDVAYLEYTSEKDKRIKMLELLRLEEHVLTILAFSGSKTFGVYGLRLGAAIGLTKSKTKIDNFRPRFVNEARGSWSATPTISIELLNHFSKKENHADFLKELKGIKDIVQKRSELFISQANEIGLKTYPFRSGFYVIALTDKPMEVFEKLTEKGIYVVPMENGIRIALCSISLKEIDGLPQKIKTLID
ncbi:pyridoxal phosphate-dependent aminotransferase [Mariniplasma anaerobium]|uniref:Aminotransferase n=1 Tax=Mariniplasma anaerobium TaxID=2735436 RepID=A0A7U9TJ53_9MOLU|nr:aminotransferase class I/II-fold pyridoxal phosphate-dependent enzyme [Mariniplasma anaerobium]BCR35135.1 aminotransferase [Mariniplasma anaerobium]